MWGRYISPMCDCEELEFEDFEVMLATLSKKSPAPAVEVPLEVPLLQVVALKQRK
jgi:hypothetical protein